ncbi:MAG: preprotein translocase subunit SecG [Cellvibrionaceae bacterium]
METMVIVFHVLAALAMIGLILLQQGKGAEMGASFGGGASQTLFGSQGSGYFFSRMTAFIAVIFFVTSFSLAVIAKDKVAVSDTIGIPTLLEQDAGDVPPAEDDGAAAPRSDVPPVEQAPGSDVPPVEDGAADIPQSSADIPAASDVEEAEAPETEQ